MRVVLDTNVLVAAGFAPRSASAAIVRAVQRGDLAIVWDERTRRETERIVTRIPRLSWARFAPIYRAEARFDGPTFPERFARVPDPDDRKFAALAAAAEAVLVTNDDDLLGVRGHLDAEILTPGELVEIS